MWHSIVPAISKEHDTNALILFYSINRETVDIAYPSGVQNTYLKRL